MKMAKRSSEEFQEVSEVSCESPNTKIRAVVESLSPMKKSKSCFHFRSLARSHLDCSCSISALAQSFSHAPGRTSTTWLVV